MSPSDESTRRNAHAAIPLFDWTASHAQRAPEQLAIHDLSAQQRYTYAELDRRARQLAAHLHAQGIGLGDRVALLAPNGVHNFDLQTACARVGAILVPLNWRLSVPELAYIVGDADAQLLVYHQSMGPAADALVAERSAMGTLCIGEAQAGDAQAGEAQAGDAQTDAYEAVMAGNAAAPPAVEVQLADVSAIMYTSGTTGRPKGALITHQMTFFNAINIGIPALVGPNTVHVNVLPLFHTGGLNCYCNPVLHAGGTVLLMRQFDPAATLRVIGDPAMGLTHFFGVPANYLFMAQHPDFASTDLSRLVNAGVGGAPIALSLLDVWAQRGVALQQGFGMTETGPSVILLDRKDMRRKVGSCGKALVHAAARVVDADGQDVAVNQVGELLVRGPSITPGYWRREAQTRDSFYGDWFRTGDAARCDEEGFYYIVERWKDMYISGGENVYPAEVENVLSELLEIREAAVVGMADAKWGETGCAVVVLHPGRQLTAEAVIYHCRSKLATFKVPGKVVFVNSLPRGATEKVLKRQLRADLGLADPFAQP
jgi:fatty-acyl-CoA synthase